MTSRATAGGSASPTLAPARRGAAAGAASSRWRVSTRSKKRRSSSRACAQAVPSFGTYACSTASVLGSARRRLYSIAPTTCGREPGGARVQEAAELQLRALALLEAAEDLQQVAITVTDGRRGVLGADVARLAVGRVQGDERRRVDGAAERRRARTRTIASSTARADGAVLQRIDERHVLPGRRSCATIACGAH